MNKVKEEKAYCEKMEGTRIRKVVMLFFTLILLSGCSWNEIRSYDGANGESEKAQELFTNDKRVVSAATIFHEDEVVAGISLKAFSRFKKDKIEKELKKELEKQYPDREVTISADSKIWMEANKLIDSDEKKDIDKTIKKLKSLLKEET